MKRSFMLTPNIEVGNFVWTADKRTKFSKRHTTNWSCEKNTINEDKHDTILHSSFSFGGIEDHSQKNKMQLCKKKHSPQQNLSIVSHT